MIHQLKVVGLLSFGTDGTDLPLKPLNILIGPNGSGKTNFLETLDLLGAVPRDVLKTVSRRGGFREWLWKGPESRDLITIEAMVRYPPGKKLRHSLMFGEKNGRLQVIDEKIEPVGKCPDKRAALCYVRPPRDKETESFLRQKSPDPEDPNAQGSLFAHLLEDGIHFRSDYLSEVSLVSLANPNDYPGLWHLNRLYRDIFSYRNWSFGPTAKLRYPASAHDRSDYLNRDCTNLAPVLLNFTGKKKQKLIVALQKLYSGIVDINFSVVGGTVALFLIEEDDREIPATRLSDGTMRYLCLLAILLNPKPGSIVVVEEPELGLHPDLLPTIADLLKDASNHCQLIVTTHSDVLVDALSDTPESVVVCEKNDGQTEMRRLDRNDLAKWLEDYTLGNLWSSGELGGNRW